VAQSQGKMKLLARSAAGKSRLMGFGSNFDRKKIQEQRH